MTSLFVQAPCSVTLDWEDASTSLASALTTYKDLCLSLEAKYLRVPMTSNLVDRIDFKLDHLHSLMEQQLSRSRSALARTRNRLASPLYRFPEEILSQIFMDVVHDYRPLMEGFAPISIEDHLTYTYRALHGLLRVCSVWRNIGMRTTGLWSTIPILDYSLGSSILGRPLHQEVKQSLQRAGAGLHLAAVLGVASHEKTELLTEYIPRFHSINLKSEHLRAIERVIDMVLESGIPLSLRELSLCHAHSPGCNISERLPSAADYLTLHECHHQASLAQLLRSVSVLRVSGIPFHWANFSFSTDLVELRIHEVTIGYESELNLFLAAIASATELRNLTIISMSAFADSEGIQSALASPAVALPKLEKLYLQDLCFNVLERILSSIIPGSHRTTLYLTEKCLYIGTIEVDSGIFQEEDVDIEDLCDILSGVPVDTLMLYGDFGDHWVTEETLRQLLHSMPSLKTLKMSQWDFFSSNWYTLKRPPYPPFPKLQNLHLTSARIFDTSGLKHVIASHRIRYLEIGASIFKDSDELCVPEELKPGSSLVRWLESRVPSVRVRKPIYEAPDFGAAKWQLW